MTRRDKGIERLRALDELAHDEYERGFLHAIRINSSHLTSDCLHGAADHIERHMQARGVKIGGMS